LKGLYEFDSSTKISSTDLAESVQEEHKIYDTPYEDEVDHGSYYVEPPDKVEKIYESLSCHENYNLLRENVR